MDRAANAAFQELSHPALSAVIPTRNRPDALRRLLDSIRDQDLDRKTFEVLVVDDGSQSEAARATQAMAQAVEYPFALAVYLQEPAGPARARNRMVHQSRGEIVLFLNDDVTLNARHFSVHRTLHRERPEQQVAVRGTTIWETGAHPSAIMRLLARTAFRVDPLLPPEKEPRPYFHTCDVSLKRAVLIAHPFDVEFSGASMEDTELACRLYKTLGLRLILTPEAVSLHHHRCGARELIRRACVNGSNAALLLRKHPEMRGLVRDYHYQISNKRRLARALLRLLRGDAEGFWEDLERIAFLRSLDKAANKINVK